MAFNIEHDFSYDAIEIKLHHCPYIKDSRHVEIGTDDNKLYISFTESQLLELYKKLKGFLIGDK